MKARQGAGAVAEIQVGGRSYHGRLSMSAVAFVDDEDLPLVSGFSWTVARRQRRTYAVAIIGGRHVLMHRLIRPGVEQIDHRNGNGLDNRRANLRPVDYEQNQQNARKRGFASSRFKGVAFHRAAGRWEAYIQKHGRKQHLGLFDTEEDAAAAYNAEASETFGEFAWLNGEVRYAS